MPRELCLLRSIFPTSHTGSLISPRTTRRATLLSPPRRKVAFPSPRGPLLPAASPGHASQLTAAVVSIMAARPPRLPAGPGRRRGAAEARILLVLLWFAGAAVEGAAGTEPPLKCDELRLGQYPERGRGWGRAVGARLL